MNKNVAFFKMIKLKHMTKTFFYYNSNTFHPIQNEKNRLYNFNFSSIKMVYKRFTERLKKKLLLVNYRESICLLLNVNIIKYIYCPDTGSLKYYTKFQIFHQDIK